MSNPILQVQGLSKEFTYWVDRPSSLKTLLVEFVQGKVKSGSKQRISVLENVDFEIQPGEFVGIMGRNGAGKSTLFKLIAGIYKPNRGTITKSGRIAPLIELGAGFHPDLSGYENIFLNAAILGFGRQATAAALPSIIEFSDLGEMIHMPVRNYSSGMLMRLGFSIGTHLPCDILLIDEVLAVGDAKFAAKCLAKVDELHRSGTTILLVTHDPGAVERHCTRGIVFGGQKKLFDGPAKEAAQAYLASL